MMPPTNDTSIWPMWFAPMAANECALLARPSIESFAVSCTNAWRIVMPTASVMPNNATTPSPIQNMRFNPNANRSNA